MMLYPQPARYLAPLPPTDGDPTAQPTEDAKAEEGDDGDGGDDDNDSDDSEPETIAFVYQEPKNPLDPMEGV